MLTPFDIEPLRPACIEPIDDVRVNLLRGILIGSAITILAVLVPWTSLGRHCDWGKLVVTARPRARLRPMQTLTERPVQRGAIKLLTMAGYEVVHIPNGSHLAGDGLARARQMAALKADGLRVGFPDLMVFGKPGQIGFIECKREKGGVVEPSQIEWRDRLTGLSWPWFLVRVPEEALLALSAWGWRP